MQLLCPKCHNIMAQYERNRVVVDQCTECKGIFLDRGELEHLAEAEKAYYGTGTPAAGAAKQALGRDREEGRLAGRPTGDRRYEDRPYDDRRREERGYEERRYDEPRHEERRYDERGYDERRHKKKKRSSMLEELFDF